jgi:hypothetical protein
VDLRFNTFCGIKKKKKRDARGKMYIYAVYIQYVYIYKYMCAYIFIYVYQHKMCFVNTFLENKDRGGESKSKERKKIEREEDVWAAKMNCGAET